MGTSTTAQIHYTSQRKSGPGRQCPRFGEVGRLSAFEYGDVCLTVPIRERWVSRSGEKPPKAVWWRNSNRLAQYPTPGSAL